MGTKLLTIHTYTAMADFSYIKILVVLWELTAPIK